MWCVVPVAGRSTRLRSVAGDRPKALLEVAGRPLIEHLIDRIGGVISDVCLVTEPDRVHLFRDCLGDRRDGVRLHYVVQAEAAGVADAVSRTVGMVRGSFAVVMGDCYYEGDVARFATDWMTTGDDGAVLIEPATAAGGQPMGLVTVSNQRIARIFKAPWDGQTEWRVAGAYVLPASYFTAAAGTSPADSGEHELEDVVTRLMADGATFSAIPYEGWRRNVNTPRDLAAVEERLGGGARSSDGSFAP